MYNVNVNVPSSTVSKPKQLELPPPVFAGQPKMLCQAYGNVHGSGQSVQDKRWEPTLPVLPKVPALPTTPNLDKEDEDDVVMLTFASLLFVDAVEIPFREVGPRGITLQIHQYHLQFLEQFLDLSVVMELDIVDEHDAVSMRIWSQ